MPNHLSSILMFSQQKQVAICHLLLHLGKSVNEYYLRAIWNSSFNTTSIIPPETKASSNRQDVRQSLLVAYTVSE